MCNDCYQNPSVMRCPFCRNDDVFLTDKLIQIPHHQTEREVAIDVLRDHSWIDRWDRLSCRRKVGLFVLAVIPLATAIGLLWWLGIKIASEV